MFSEFVSLFADLCLESGWRVEEGRGMLRRTRERGKQGETDAVSRDERKPIVDTQQGKTTGGHANNQTLSTCLSRL